MLAAQSNYLQAVAIINVALMILGGLCGLGFAVWLLRAGRWRNPLAGAEPGAGGPSLVHVCAVFLVYAGTLYVLVRAFAGNAEIAEAEPGSHLWFVGQIADAVAKLATAAVIVWILRRPSVSGKTPARGLGPAAIVAVGVLGGLIITPACTVQLQAATIVAKWFRPEFVPPEHVVLAAIEAGVLDWRGKLLLLAGAVLVAPIAEELFFRGLLLRTLWCYTRHAWLSVAISGLAFGVIHFPQPQAILPLCSMGIALGYVRVRTGSLTACIIVHALFNSRTMVLALFFPELIGNG